MLPAVFAANESSGVRSQEPSHIMPYLYHCASGFGSFPDGIRRRKCYRLRRLEYNRFFS